MLHAGTLRSRRRCDDCEEGAENGSQVMESERAEDTFSACQFHLSDMRLHFRLSSKTSYHIEGLW